MAKRMLIDATHPEETRVVVLNGHRLEEFDFESSTKKQVKGNIYLAKVTRVEPSLQAAFVEYGGNRHGFLAFSEIHPDYYRIPVADRPAGGWPAPHEPEPPNDASGLPASALPPGEAGTADGSDGADEEDFGVPLEVALPIPVVVPAAAVAEDDGGEPESEPDEPGTDAAAEPAVFWADSPEAEAAPVELLAAPPPEETPNGVIAEEEFAAASAPLTAFAGDELLVAEAAPTEAHSGEGDAEPVEILDGDEFEEAERQRSRTVRHYKIQEVIKRRQIMLVQVTKEERGNKGAALTTYLSLAGRYCVLMPNTARGGGVSRKIVSLTDRRRLKDILEELEIPDGMGVIVRTAGAERSKPEIKRDYEYLLRLWNDIRELTLRSTAPALIYEEGNLIKRSIRDLYTRDIDEVLVEGEEGYRTAKSFMKMLMPSHAKRVQPYRDPQIGLLHRYQVEAQIDAIHSPIVQLRSGGYLVINQTEALVAIDVNSGRSTRERNIEETALRTNLEAAEELARQLRLRDLAGLIVIDFIDMEEHRNQGAVERRIKEALKNDRARIQVGRISPFGLMEMSRQRLRPSLVEASTQPCPHCGGTGFVRSTESTALYVLRSVEEEGIRQRSAEVCIYVPTAVALYILNQKRDSLIQLEARYTMRVLIARDDALIPPAFRLERLRPYSAAEAAAGPPAPLTQTAVLVPMEDEEDAADEEVESTVTEHRDAEAGDERRRGRRRRRRPRRHEEASAADEAAAAPEQRDAAAGEAEPEDDNGDGQRRRRRRGRRSGKRRSRFNDEAAPGNEATAASEATAIADTIEILPTGTAEEEENGAIASEPALAAMTAPEAGFETASLPALAGEPAAESPIAPEPEAEPRWPDQTATPEPEPEPAPTPPPTAEAEAGVPLAEAGTDLAPSETEHVQTVDERPANPRRGWWQRLTQP